MICLPELPDLGLEIEMDETLVLILGQTALMLISSTIGYFIGSIEGPNLCAKLRRIFTRQRQHPVRAASPEQRSLTTGSPVSSTTSPKQAETPRSPEDQAPEAKPEVSSPEAGTATEGAVPSLPTTSSESTPPHSHRLAKVQAQATAKSLAHEAKGKTAGSGPDAISETERSVKKASSGRDHLEVGQKSTKDEKQPDEKKVKAVKVRKTKPARKSQMSTTDVSGDDVEHGPRKSPTSEITQGLEDDKSKSSAHKEPKEAGKPKARGRRPKQPKSADASPKETPTSAGPKETSAEKEAPQTETKEPEAKVEGKVTIEPGETKESVLRPPKKGPQAAKITKSKESTESPKVASTPGKLASRESLHARPQGKTAQPADAKSPIKKPPGKEIGIPQQKSTSKLSGTQGKVTKVSSKTGKFGKAPTKAGKP